MATIDPCEMNQKLHGICAVVFFVLMIVYSIINFDIVAKIKEKDPTFVNAKSWNRKKLTIYILYPVAIFFLILDAFDIRWGLPVAEWIGALSIIFYLKTF